MASCWRVSCESRRGCGGVEEGWGTNDAGAGPHPRGGAPPAVLLHSMGYPAWAWRAVRRVPWQPVRRRLPEPLQQEPPRVRRRLPGYTQRVPGQRKAVLPWACRFCLTWRF